MKKSRLLSKHRILFAGVLIVLGVIFRTVLHIGDNVEFVTAGSLLAGSYLGFFYALGVPLSTMIITDLLIGNTNIFLFTWSAYAMIGIGGYLIQISNIKNQKSKINYQKLKILRATGLGVVASLWFYIWTNFGVWLFDSWGMYPNTLSGLIDAYILGLPFLKLSMIGNLVFVPLSFTIVESIAAIGLKEARRGKKPISVLGKFFH